MAYEIFLLPVAAGGEAEEAGEALLARLDGVTEVEAAGPPEAAALPVLAALRHVDPSIAAAPPREPARSPSRPVAVASFRAAHSIEVTLARTFVRFRVPFHHRGEDAESVFGVLFRLIDAARDATGWVAYDPQDAAAVEPGEPGRDAMLEIYLSVMDQLRPSRRGTVTG